MRDSGVPYSGDPHKNKLLPLPRPTYTEFINRAKQAKMPNRLDFLYCSAEALRPPRLQWENWERVVWCGVSFRRFAKRWTPERSQFFTPSFQQRALTVMCCAWRLRSREPGGLSLGCLPAELLLDIVAQSAEKADCRYHDYDDLAVVCSGARHLFLPAPGSSGEREALFDAVFGLT